MMMTSVHKGGYGQREQRTNAMASNMAADPDSSGVDPGPHSP